MARGSEQISTKWIEGAERICIKCDAPIKNLARDVGEVRTRYVSGKEVAREIICTPCHLELAEQVITRTRQELWPK